jgi:hypothetical protein
VKHILQELRRKKQVTNLYDCYKTVPKPFGNLWQAGLMRHLIPLFEDNIYLELGLKWKLLYNSKEWNIQYQRRQGHNFAKEHCNSSIPVLLFISTFLICSQTERHLFAYGNDVWISPRNSNKKQPDVRTISHNCIHWEVKGILNVLQPFCSKSYSFPIHV